jgi:hypothetical protein
MVLFFKELDRDETVAFVVILRLIKTRFNNLATYKDWAYLYNALVLAWTKDGETWRHPKNERELLLETHILFQTVSKGSYIALVDGLSRMYDWYLTAMGLKFDVSRNGRGLERAKNRMSAKEIEEKLLPLGIDYLCLLFPTRESNLAATIPALHEESKMAGRAQEYARKNRPSDFVAKCCEWRCHVGDGEASPETYVAKVKSLLEDDDCFRSCAVSMGETVSKARYRGGRNKEKDHANDYYAKVSQLLANPRSFLAATQILDDRQPYIVMLGITFLMLFDKETVGYLDKLTDMGDKGVFPCNVESPAVLKAVLARGLLVPTYNLGRAIELSGKCAIDTPTGKKVDEQNFLSSVIAAEFTMIIFEVDGLLIPCNAVPILMENNATPIVDCSDEQPQARGCNLDSLVAIVSRLLEEGVVENVKLEIDGNKRLVLCFSDQSECSLLSLVKGCFVRSGHESSDSLKADALPNSTMVDKILCSAKKATEKDVSGADVSSYATLATAAAARKAKNATKVHGGCPVAGGQTENADNPFQSLLARHGPENISSAVLWILNQQNDEEALVGKVAIFLKEVLVVMPVESIGTNEGHL